MKLLNINALDVSRETFITNLKKEFGFVCEGTNEYCLHHKTELIEIDGDIYSLEFLENSDNFVLLESGNWVNQYDAFYCFGYESFFHTEERWYLVKGKYDEIYSYEYITHHSNDFVKYEGEYYQFDELARFDLAIENLYWYDNQWNLSEEDEEYVSEYHENQTPKFVVFEGDSNFSIGFEIEKEDIDVKESIDINYFKECFPLFRKEKDGSLDDTGFEIVTPVFPLNTEKIKEYFSEYSINGKGLLNHINADISDSCGGHINLSQKHKCNHEPCCGAYQ